MPIKQFINSVVWLTVGEGSGGSLSSRIGLSFPVVVFLTFLCGCVHVHVHVFICQCIFFLFSSVVVYHAEAMV